MKSPEPLKKSIKMLMSFILIAMQTAVFYYSWVAYYGYRVEVGFYRRGTLLAIAFYVSLLILFSRMYGGTKIGYLKTGEVVFSQYFALLFANAVEYLLLCLLYLGVIRIVPLLQVLLLQAVIVAIWIPFAAFVYSRIFRPRDMLIVYGDYPIEGITEKFATRKDKYNIKKAIHMSEGFDNVLKEIENGYDAIVLWDLSTDVRNKLLKFCYGKSIRVYMMPKIPDVLVRGSDQLHLFDTPILLVREYTLSFDQRFIKRTIDLVCAVLLTIITSPIMLITAILVKCYDGGPVFYKQVRCTRNMREFKIIKFRSMRVDAEKDGVARLAQKNDSRITPIGKFIRKVRIDELPQLFNIIKGDMSFIGPRPERPEIIKQYLEEMPEFVFRTKVKAGLAGYAQVYGKYNTTPLDKLKLDLFYIENYTVWLDIRLMLLTLKILLKPESTEGVESNQTTAIKGK